MNRFSPMRARRFLQCVLSLQLLLCLVSVNTLVLASPVQVFVGQMLPGDQLKISNAGITDVYVSGAGGGGPASELPGALYKFAPAGRAGWITVTSTVPGKQPEAEMLPTTIIVPVAPPPPPPGGVGGGAPGAGAGAGGGALIPAGVSEIGLASLIFAGAPGATALGSSLVSFGIDGGFVASYLTLAGDMFDDVFDALLPQLLAHGLSAYEAGNGLHIRGYETAIASNMDPGLRLSFRIATANIAEPSSFLLAGLALAGLLSVRSGALRCRKT